MILIFIIAISLSMDAFSLSLAYGTNNLTKKEVITLSSIVGIFHFVMPILGIVFGNFMIELLNVGKDLVIFIIFGFIGINMIIDSVHQKSKIDIMRIKEMLLFGFAVSIDSFSVGISIEYSNLILSSLIFSIVSFSFTYIGLILGKKLNLLVGRLSTIIGGGVLIVLGISYLIVK